MLKFVSNVIYFYSDHTISLQKIFDNLFDQTYLLTNNFSTDIFLPQIFSNPNFFELNFFNQNFFDQESFVPKMFFTKDICNQKYF